METNEDLSEQQYRLLKEYRDTEVEKLLAQIRTCKLLLEPILDTAMKYIEEDCRRNVKNITFSLDLSVDIPAFNCYDCKARMLCDMIDRELTSKGYVGVHAHFKKRWFWDYSNYCVFVVDFDMSSQDIPK